MLLLQMKGVGLRLVLLLGRVVRAVLGGAVVGIVDRIIVRALVVVHIGHDVIVEKGESVELLRGFAR